MESAEGLFLLLVQISKVSEIYTELGFLKAETGSF
jgi:hypothetical protein